MADTVYFYPNKMGRIIMQALEEVIGRKGVNAVLNRAGLFDLVENFPPNNLNLEFPFDNVGQIHAALENLYGPRGGRGIALRAGRVTFKYGLREFGPLLGFTDLAFRLMPQDTRLKQGGTNFAEIFNRFSDQRVRLEEHPTYFYWHIDRCPVCWQRQTNVPCCHLAVGLLQEALFWVTGGKIFRVEETHCIAKGDAACSIVIDKQPSD